jgi:hypothetical protein
MTEEDNDQAEPEESSSRPDSFFKLLTAAEAKAVGLQEQPTEFQYTSLADLVFAVPDKVSLAGTIFDFFRPLSVVEFKSENDPLTLKKFIKNEVRTGILCLQKDFEDYSNILNVYVVARKPDKLFEIAESRNIKLTNTPAKKWLWQGQVGFQDVAIVVCRDLPLKEQYYIWIMFAPAKSPKWRDLIKRLYKERNQKLLDIAAQLRTKEFAMVITDELIKTAQAEWSAEEKAKAHKEQVEGYKLIIEKLLEYPELLGDILETLTLERRQFLLQLLNKAKN